MDTSSRNIVKFIGTITVAALLIMAARYYSMSEPAEAPPVAEEVATPKPAQVDIQATEEDSLDDTEEPEVIEEDVEIKMGEPSVNIGQEAPTYSEAAPVQPVEPEVVSEPAN